MAHSGLCSIPDCGNGGELKRGLCNTHYKRWRRHGDPSIGARQRPICSVPDCGKPHLARSLCSGHYHRWRQGRPIDAPPQKGYAQAYFRDVVLTYDGNECLTWPYTRDGKGRAKISVKGRMKNLSRIVCIEANGPPPAPKHHAAHSCGKGHLGCVAKGHLSWKTPAENEADKITHGTARCGGTPTNALLTEEQARLILSMKGAASERSIAKLFGVSRSNVHLIHTGKAWRRALTASRPA